MDIYMHAYVYVCDCSVICVLLYANTYTNLFFIFYVSCGVDETAQVLASRSDDLNSVPQVSHSCFCILSVSTITHTTNAKKNWICNSSSYQRWVRTNGRIGMEVCKQAWQGWESGKETRKIDCWAGNRLSEKVKRGHTDLCSFPQKAVRDREILGAVP